jgi:predicted RND superfamily exporter protein
VLVVATTNWVVATMAITSIVGIMLTVFATMVALGWKISVLESVSMIVVVGMSVDYTVHLMHSYHECAEATRFGRARLAMTEMGVSVFGGALTTFVAACPLFFAKFVFFSQFGSFIGMITVYSIVWAIFFLMTLAAFAGPEARQDGNGGGVGHLYGEITFFKPKGKGSSGVSDSNSDEAGQEQGQGQGQRQGQADDNGGGAGSHLAEMRATRAV